MFGAEPQFALSLESPVWCLFHTTTHDRTCRSACTEHGVECLAAFDNYAECVIYSWTANCDSVFNTQLCACAQP